MSLKFIPAGLGILLRHANFATTFSEATKMLGIVQVKCCRSQQNQDHLTPHGLEQIKPSQETLY